MPHPLCLSVKHEYEVTKHRPSDLREVVPSGEAVNPITKGSLFNSMALYSGGRQAGDDDESLTGMMTESTTTEPYHPNHATY